MRSSVIWLPVLIGMLCILVSASAVAQADVFSTEVIEIEVRLPETAWHDTLFNRKSRGDKTPLIGTVTIHGKTYDDIEVSYKGNSSFHGAALYGVTKMPLKFETSKGNSFDGGYDELRLSNNYRDPSAVRELLSFMIASTYVPTSNIGIAVVTVNGTYVGVYTMTEGMSDRMLEEHYCTSEGILIKCDPQDDQPASPGCPAGEHSNLAYIGDRGGCYKPLYHVKKPEEIRTIVELCSALDGASDPETYLNVHEALWMHALNNVMVNLDSYLGLFSHNYYVYKDTSGIYHPLIWDLNLSFGGFAHLAQGVSPNQVKLSPIVHDKHLRGRRPLIQTLTEDKRHLYTYFFMMNTILEDWFANGRYTEEAGRLQGLIEPFILREENPTYSIDDFRNNLAQTVKEDERKRSIPGLTELMEDRVDYLSGHRLLDRPAPGLTDWSTQVYDAGIAVTAFSDRELESAYLYFKRDVCSPWQRAEMEQMGEITWQVTVDQLHSCYFLLRGDKGVSLAPRSAPGRVFSPEDSRR